LLAPILSVGAVRVSVFRTAGALDRQRGQRLLLGLLLVAPTFNTLAPRAQLAYLQPIVPRRTHCLASCECRWSGPQAHCTVSAVNACWLGLLLVAPTFNAPARRCDALGAKSASIPFP